MESRLVQVEFAMHANYQSSFHKHRTLYFQVWNYNKRRNTEIRLHFDKVYKLRALGTFPAMFIKPAASILLTKNTSLVRTQYIPNSQCHTTVVVELKENDFLIRTFAVHQ